MPPVLDLDGLHRRMDGWMDCHFVWEEKATAEEEEGKKTESGKSFSLISVRLATSRFITTPIGWIPCR